MSTAAPLNGPRTLVYSEQHLIAQGIVDLLPDGWREGATIVDRAGGVELALHDPLNAAIVDAGAADAGYAATSARARGASVVALIASTGERHAEWLLRETDAVLVRDEVDPRALRVALAVGRLGLRVVPRELPTAVETARPAQASEPLPEPAQRALSLLARGLRDAEIAEQLNLSESAVRKLIQRAVKRAGARTRCQAVADATRAGDLD